MRTPQPALLVTEPATNRLRLTGTDLELAPASKSFGLQNGAICCIGRLLTA